jgi:hypothetical protein
MALQVVQWHIETRENGSATSKVTPPQRQLPLNDPASGMSAIYRRHRGKSDEQQGEVALAEAGLCPARGPAIARWDAV